MPESWWETDKELEVDESGFLLPTAKDVVEQSADELKVPVILSIHPQSDALFHFCDDMDSLRAIVG